jgi:hypothetical protein
MKLIITRYLGDLANDYDPPEDEETIEIRDGLEDIHLLINGDTYLIPKRALGIHVAEATTPPRCNHSPNTPES